VTAPRYTAEDAARIFGADLDAVRRQYRRNAVQLRECEAKARQRGVYRGFTAAQWAAFAEHAERQGGAA
jgi:hypothetical protein